MCSVLIFSKRDNDHPDSSLEWQKFKRGYVVDVRDPDDFHWGNDVQGVEALGWWRVVIVPDATAADLRSLIGGEAPTEPSAPYRLRTNKIDLDSLERGKNLQKSEVLTISAEQLLAARSVVPPVTSPRTIGENPRVIG